MDRRYLLAPKRVGLGDVFDPVAGLFSLGSSLITAGGQVGSAVISADATKYVVRQNDKTQVALANIQTQGQNVYAQTQSDATTQQLNAVASTLTSWPVLLFGLALAVIVTGGRRDGQP